MRNISISKCDFSLRHYFETLDNAREQGYSIRRVASYCPDCPKFILLRHDIDFSLEYAYKLAVKESEHGIRSSYYVYLHSDTYNVFTADSMSMLRKIRELGHEIGLHYDSRYDVVKEDAVLGRIIDDNVKTFTQHNPGMTTRPDSYKLGLENPNELPVKYISDSGRNWREGCFCQWIGKEDKLHVLTHPIWWIKEGVREKVLYNLIDDCKKNLDKTHLVIQQMLKEYLQELGIATV